MKPLITFLKENYLEDVESRICAINTILGCDVESLYEEGGLELDEILHLDEDHFNIYLEMLMENKEEAGQIDEEAGQLDELSRATKTSYLMKAVRDVEKKRGEANKLTGLARNARKNAWAYHDAANNNPDGHIAGTPFSKMGDIYKNDNDRYMDKQQRLSKQIPKRIQGVHRAARALAKEEAMNTENKLNEIEHPKSPKWDPLVTVYEKGSMTGHMWLSTANKIYRTNISAADVRRKKNVTSGNIRFELSPHHKEEYDPTEVNEASYANMGMNVSSMSASDLVRKWSQDPKVRREYEAQQRAKRSRKKVDSKRKSVTT